MEHATIAIFSVHDTSAAGLYHGVEDRGQVHAGACFLLIYASLWKECLMDQRLQQSRALQTFIPSCTT